MTYPNWICADCGDKYGKFPQGHVATWHEDECGWCGEAKIVTEPRDFGWPEFHGTKALENAGQGRLM